MADIPIKFINAITNKEKDVSVVIFTKNFNPNASPNCVAWNILSTKESEKLTYSDNISIEVSGLNCEVPGKSASFSATNGGSTWHITHESFTDEPVLKRGKYN